MFNFVLALIAFLAAHIVPRATGLRDWGINRFGRKVYMSAYSLLSIALLVWLVVAALNAPYWGLWGNSQITVAIAIGLMFFACILFVGGATRSNSLSISFLGGETDLANPGILALLPHPIITAFLLWSAAHLLVNGDVIGVILFGGMLLFSLMGMKVVHKRAQKRLGADELAKYQAISAGPVGSRLNRAFSTKFVVELIVGALLFFVLLFGHEFVIGVGPMAYF